MDIIMCNDVLYIDKKVNSFILSLVGLYFHS